MMKVGVQGHEPRDVGNLKTWERQGMDSSFIEDVQPCSHFDFSAVKLIFDFWPTELEDCKPILFKPLNLL